MLGFMLVTAFVSMWITNTATTAMMTPIMEAVLKELDKEYMVEAVEENESEIANTDEESPADEGPSSLNIGEQEKVELKKTNSESEMIEFTDLSADPLARSISQKELVPKYSTYFFTMTTYLRATKLNNQRGHLKI